MVCAPPPLLWKFPNVAFDSLSYWNNSSLQWLDNVPLSSFQGRLSSTFSFPLFLRLSASYDQWWDVLDFVPAGSVSSSSTLQIFQAACDGCFACQSICLVMSGMSSASVFERWMSDFVFGICQTGLSILLFFFFFVARALNLWGMACVVCGWHVWQFAPPSSSWGLRPYRLHRLHSWWLHLAWQWSPTLTGLWWLFHHCTLWGL